MADKTINDLTDLAAAPAGASFVPVWESGATKKVSVTNLLTNVAEVNDLTSVVTWANIPDANVPESAVTQHQAALSITQSQISDLDFSGYLPLTAGASYPLTGQLYLPSGDQNQHAININYGPTNLGLWGYNVDTGSLVFSRSSNARFCVSGSGVGLASGLFYGLGNSFATSSCDTRLYRDDAYIFAQRNGTNAQTSRIYGSHTDASNYERLSLSADGAGTVTLAAETLGTGADDVDIELLVAGEYGVFRVGTASDTDRYALLDTNRVQLGDGAIAGAGGIAIGYLSSTQNLNEVAVGNEASTNNGQAETAVGSWAKTTLRGASAFGTRSLGNRDGQTGFGRSPWALKGNYGVMAMHCQTTDSTATKFLGWGGHASNAFNVPSGHTVAFHGIVVAQKTDKSENAMWLIDGLIKNDSGTTTLVYSNVDGNGKNDNSNAWTLALSADDTNDCLQVELTAEATVEASLQVSFVEQDDSNIIS